VQFSLIEGWVYYGRDDPGGEGFTFRIFFFEEIFLNNGGGPFINMGLFPQCGCKCEGGIETFDVSLHHDTYEKKKAPFLSTKLIHCLFYMKIGHFGQRKNKYNKFYSSV